MIPTVYRPEYLWLGGQLLKSASLAVDATGTVVAEPPAYAQVVLLPGRVLLPGFVNAHSHAFQRVLRGRTEYVSHGHANDDFWSWRELMYRAATALSPEGVYLASRQAFVEMALAGVTSVGEFHYLHHQSDGTPYDDVHLLARGVVRAAREVGLRIALLRVGYARAGFKVLENPRQARFLEPDVDTYLQRTVDLGRALSTDPLVTIGLAPHSVRAVPRDWLEAIARSGLRSVIHLHVAEQPAEVAQCLAEHGQRPVELLSEVGLLGPRTTAVHAVHLLAHEVDLLAASKASVCACPSTEKNLGDGVVPADLLFKAQVPVCFGSDSQAEIDVLGEARQLEGHLRLIHLKRAVLDPGTGEPSGLGRRLLRCATENGARALGLDVGFLSPGQPADFVTLDLEHPSLVGCPEDALAAGLAFGAERSAVREVAVQGQFIVQDGRHPLSETSGREFSRLMKELSSL